MFFQKYLVLLFTLVFNNSFSMNPIEEKQLGYKLVLAAWNRDLQKIIHFIEKKFIDINSQDEFGYTALHVAVNVYDKKILLYLLKMNAKINTQNQYGITPLIDAVKLSRKDFVRYLIEHGANINEKDILGETALHWAAYKDLWDITQYLIENHANINLKDNKGLRAGDIAFNKDIIILFQKRAYEIYHELKPALFEVIEKGEYNKIKKIALKISMGFYDGNHNNPLHIAAKYNKPEIFQLILAIRPSLIYEINKDGKMPLELNPGIACFLLDSLKYKERIENNLSILRRRGFIFY